MGRDHVASDGAVAYILRSYPRLSQTFVLNEILALERAGIDLLIFAMVRPDEALSQPAVAHVRAPVRYLRRSSQRRLGAIAADHARLLCRRPAPYLRTVFSLLRRRDLEDGYTTATRWECFDAAVRVTAGITAAGRAGMPVTHVHSHFAHDPTLIALLVKSLTGLPFSFTAHARDLYQTPEGKLAERIHEATAVVTCCGANVRYLARIAGRDASKVRLIHHGVDPSLVAAARCGPGPPREPLVVSAGRLVEKKGLADLIDACALLKQQGRSFRCAIIGEGPLAQQLSERISARGLAAEVTLAGACRQEELCAQLRSATVFALTPVELADGDRDGIPNVVLEAMACGVPVVSTSVAGVPEVVVHGETGLLARPGDVAEIARCIAALLDSPSLRTRLSHAGRRVIEEGFDAGRSAQLLAEILRPRAGAV